MRHWGGVQLLDLRHCELQIDLLKVWMAYRTNFRHVLVRSPWTKYHLMEGHDGLPELVVRTVRVVFLVFESALLFVWSPERNSWLWLTVIFQ